MAFIAEAVGAVLIMRLLSWLALWTVPGRSPKHIVAAHVLAWATAALLYSFGTGTDGFSNRLSTMPDHLPEALLMYGIGFAVWCAIDVLRKK